MTNPRVIKVAEKTAEKDLWARSTEAEAMWRLGLKYSTQAKRLGHVADRLTLAEKEHDEEKKVEWARQNRETIMAVQRERERERDTVQTDQDAVA